jgi:hypothetical protein
MPGNLFQSGFHRQQLVVSEEADLPEHDNCLTAALENILPSNGTRALAANEPGS